MLMLPGSLSLGRSCVGKRGGLEPWRGMICRLERPASGSVCTSLLSFGSVLEQVGKTIYETGCDCSRVYDGLCRAVLGADQPRGRSVARVLSAAGALAT